MRRQIVILNGAPRAGKTSIARAMQDRLDGVWLNLGVDVFQQAAPRSLQPSIGLRPGAERPDIEAVLPDLVTAFYDSVAAHGRLGFNVAVDIGHHDSYTSPLGLFARGLRRLSGLPVLVVGVRCPVPVILERRARSNLAQPGLYVERDRDGTVPPPVLAWEREVHDPGIYDLEVDTSTLSPEGCCDRIGEVLRRGIPCPSAAQRILAGDGPEPGGS